MRGKEGHMQNKRAITKDDCYLFGEGTHYEIYEKLGAHVTEIDGVKRSEEHTSELQSH